MFDKKQLLALLDNPLMDVDSYKHTHYPQYPDNVVRVEANIE